MNDQVSPQSESGASNMDDTFRSASVDRRTCLGLAGLALAMGSALTPTEADAQQISPPLTRTDYVNFLLNIHYLQASVYSGAIRGEFLPASVLGLPAGTPTERQPIPVGLADPLARAFVAEMLDTELAHITSLKAALGGAAIAAPVMFTGPSANLDDGFTRIFARIVNNPNSGYFNLYGVEENYLIATSYLKDIAVTAYQEVVANVEADDGVLVSIMGTQAYQAAILRDLLYERAQRPGSRLLQISEQLASVRGSSDPAGSFTDQGLTPISTTAGFVSNIVPTDERGRAKARTPALVLLQLVGRPALFFPGAFFVFDVNGRINRALLGLT